jgi:hypothetical protein
MREGGRWPALPACQGEPVGPFLHADALPPDAAWSGRSVFPQQGFSSSRLDRENPGRLARSESGDESPDFGPPLPRDRRSGLALGNRRSDPARRFPRRRAVVAGVHCESPRRRASLLARRREFGLNRMQVQYLAGDAPHACGRLRRKIATVRTSPNCNSARQSKGVSHFDPPNSHDCARERWSRPRGGGLGLRPGPALWGRAQRLYYPGETKTLNFP